MLETEGLARPGLKLLTLAAATLEIWPAHRGLRQGRKRKYRNPVRKGPRVKPAYFMR